MARAHLSSLLTDLSGSIGSTTFQNSNAGTIIRNKPSSVGNFSPHKQINRNYNFQIHQSWKSLSDIERTQWQAFSNFINIKQKHSAYLNISGQSLFYKINFYRLTFSLGILTIPVFTNIHPLPVVVTLSVSPTNMFATCYGLLTPTTEFIALQVTGIISKSVNNFKNRLKFILFRCPKNASSIIGSRYINLYGAIPKTGDTVGYSWFTIDDTNGLISSTQTAKITL